MKYEFSAIDKKWQDKWDEKKAFKVSEDYSKPKYYTLIEFPYPSGQGLHIGHPRPYTAMDIVSRKKRMEGYNVLFPMGLYLIKPTITRSACLTNCVQVQTPRKVPLLPSVFCVISMTKASAPWLPPITAS